MGYYINPGDRTKEQFLKEHGTSISQAQAREHKASDRLVVCLVDNGAFTAAGIAYDDRERDAFMHPDHRTRWWYLVDRAKLLEVSDLPREKA